MGGLPGTQWASRFVLVSDTGISGNEGLASFEEDLGLIQTEHNNSVTQDRGV